MMMPPFEQGRTQFLILVVLLSISKCFSYIQTLLPRTLAYHHATTTCRLFSAQQATSSSLSPPLSSSNKTASATIVIVSAPPITTTNNQEAAKLAIAENGAAEEAHVEANNPADRLAKLYRSKGYAIRYVSTSDTLLTPADATEGNVVSIFDVSNRFPLWGVELSREMALPYYRYQMSTGMFKLMNVEEHTGQRPGMDRRGRRTGRVKKGRLSATRASKASTGQEEERNDDVVNNASSSSEASSDSKASRRPAAPLWIDPGSADTYEALMEKRGWGFLHHDTSEPSRSFDVESVTAVFKAPLPWQRGTKSSSTSPLTSSADSNSGKPKVATDDSSSLGDRCDDGVGQVELSPLGYDISSMTNEQVAVAADAAQLNDLQRKVMLAGGTETPFKGQTVNGVQYKDLKRAVGVYICAIGGLPLFSSENLYESGTGWPSFTRPIDPSHVIERPDVWRGGTEVLCRRSGVHLGHVFADGPRPTGRRYCMNAACFNFIAEGSVLPAGSLPVGPPQQISGEDGYTTTTTTSSKGTEATSYHDGAGGVLKRMIKAGLQLNSETAYFGGGCFWHVQRIFDMVAGVMDTQAGYRGGTVESPSYEEVCSGRTGHVEVVKVIFRPEVVTFAELVGLFWAIHDPTTGNRQGADWGLQYQAVLFCDDGEEEQMTQAEELFGAKRLHLAEQGASLQTRLVKHKGTFWPAEPAHQHYLGLPPKLNISLKGS